jgi:excisionase family DNA binding protein
MAYFIHWMGYKMEKEYITIKELSETFNIPKRTIEKWVFKKRLPVVRCGRLIRFPRIEIEKRILNGSLLK